ncbi:MAG: ribosomal protein S18-alanine N-acetyltransferase [Chloroflexi bacterium]|nr:ribosomal protein S18-alanine N-acetyltransferase [Chloroflexota bacterium]
MDLSGLPFTLEIMLPSDILTVSSIEGQVFATPWSAEAYLQELLYHVDAYYYVLRFTDRNVLDERYPQRPWAGTHDPALIGYGGLWLILEQGHVSTLAVRPSWRGRGLGELLFASLVEKAMDVGCEELTLEVRITNQRAQNLYAKYGLQVTGRRPRYYPDNQEDAWIMSSPPLHGYAYREAFGELVGQLRSRLLSERQTIPELTACQRGRAQSPDQRT